MVVAECGHSQEEQPRGPGLARATCEWLEAANPGRPRLAAAPACASPAKKLKEFKAEDCVKKKDERMEERKLKRRDFAMGIREKGR
jgi:hypothetical protein